MEILEWSHADTEKIIFILREDKQMPQLTHRRALRVQRTIFATRTPEVSRGARVSLATLTFFYAAA